MRDQTFELSFDELYEVRDTVADYLEDTPLPDPGEAPRFGRT